MDESDKIKYLIFKKENEKYIQI